MKNSIKKFIKILSTFNLMIDFVMIPFTIIGGAWFRIAKYIELKKLPFTKKLLLKIGVFPLVDHYYEPQFNFSQVDFSKKRQVSSIDLNVAGQLEFLDKLNFQNELSLIPLKSELPHRYYYHNSSFQSGDAELYYSIIRHIQPKRIIEIGSGFSTLLALEAIHKNETSCNLTCIEPYEMIWLEKLGIDVIRKKVEDIELSMFTGLESGDILFIDSSHVIRPQGDVMFEIFEILPLLKPGVLIHFHDIFTPNDYPEDWIVSESRFWNEQYLLEAFLSYNSKFTILSAMNYLKNNHFEHFSKVFPILSKEIHREPGSLWLVKK